MSDSIPFGSIFKLLTGCPGLVEVAEWSALIVITKPRLFSQLPTKELISPLHRLLTAYDRNVSKLNRKRINEQYSII